MTKEELKAKLAKEIDDAELDAVAGGTLNESADDLYRLFEVNQDAAMNIAENYSLNDPDAFQNAVAEAVGRIPGVTLSQGRNDKDGNNFYIYKAKDGTVYAGMGDANDRQRLWNAIIADHGSKQS